MVALPAREPLHHVYILYFAYLLGHECELCQTAELIEMPFGLWSFGDPVNHLFHGARIPMRRGTFGVIVSPMVDILNFIC